MNITYHLAIEKADSLRREKGMGWSDEYKAEILQAMKEKNKDKLFGIASKSMAEVMRADMTKITV